jgi:two-component system sensor histidine kinase/response regulator
VKESQATRVMVVDDDVIVLESIIQILSLRNYDVVGRAVDGIQAIEVARQVQPDLVLMDIMMPKMGGIEAAQRIYRQLDIPVILLTAFDTPELVQDAQNAGVMGYLLKPLDASEMERTITIAIARHRDTQNLRRLNAELKAYAHTVAHDLKNPLMQVIGYTELLLLDQGDGILTPEKTRQYGMSIMTGSLRMKNTINELLLLAEARDREVTPDILDMMKVVNDVIDSLSMLLENSQAQIDLPEFFPAAIGYEPWITEVWSNYIINAVKYGGKPPLIQLGADILPDSSVKFWIKDNGPGILPEKQGKLFTAFETLHKTAVATGTGLGLSIVKRIIDRLGGTVGVESSGVDGEGSLFYFTLPEVTE